MAHVLIMPRLGNTVESCIVVKWKVSEGAAVTAESPVCEVETDKATMDVPAGAVGIVLKILRAEGDDVPVLEPIVVIGAQGEDWRAALGGAVPAIAPKAVAAAAPATTIPAPEAAIPAASPEVATPPAAGPGNPARGVSPRARALAAAESVNPAILEGSGPGGRVIERDIAAALAGRPALTAAAKASMSSGAYAAGAASAFGNRAGVADLVSADHAREAALQAGAGTATIAADGHAPGATGAASTADFPGPFTDTPMKGVRKIIAERMAASLRTTAQLTLNSSAPADRLMALRARFKDAGTNLGMSGVTIGDLVMFAVARALGDFPALNAHLKDGTLRTFGRVHLGVAVDTPRGLMVPVVRNANLLSLPELSTEIKRLAAACVEGKANPDDLSGSTFTVSNLGAFGIESFTPVLNAPETAILGVCAVTARAVQAADGSVRFEKRLGLSLTMDHQAADGADGARFLKSLSDTLGDIDIAIAR